MQDEQVQNVAPVVSFADEPLILVDSHDQPVGTMTKEAAHQGQGILHRAFSIFVFNPAGDVLLQQRSADKTLWGGFWANSCCSHPRRGEDTGAAAQRRQSEELGLNPTLSYLYKFEYHAQFGDLGAEHELCSVFAGCTAKAPAVNANEIDATIWLSPAELDDALKNEPALYTPWLQFEWPRIRSDYWATIEALLATHN